MKDRFLPIGTVVLLKDGKKNVMITSYLIFAKGESKEKKLFDYGGCTFPEGIIESNYAVGFNHDQIEKVVHMGLENNDQKKLSDTLNTNYDEIKKKFADGEIKI